MKTQQAKALLVLLLLAVTHAEDLITQARVDTLRADGVAWAVTDASKSPLRDQSLERFKETLQDNGVFFKESRPTGTNEEIFVHDEDLPEVTDVPEEKIPNVDGIARADPVYDAWGLPINFDGRTVWGKCIHTSADQGSCNGCWAFGIVNHLSDRFCVQGKDVILSVQDLLECTPGNKCCSGGYASNGYKYIMQTGLVADSCKRYRKTCTECRPSSCTHYKCKPNSMFWASTIQQAKREIYNNGPIEAVFDVYDDFPYYAGGVYYRTSNKLLGVHTVEVLGWGKQNGTEYWLCKNSWGSTWGDKGFFKIKLGDCDVNNALTTCAPLIES